MRTQLKNVLEHVFFKRYNNLKQEAQFQIRAMVLVHAGISLILGLILLVTDAGVDVRGAVLSILLFNIALLALIFVGQYRIANWVALPGYWAGITYLAYTNASFQQYEVYRLTTFYMVVIFIAAMILRRNLKTVLLSVFSILSVWANYVYWRCWKGETTFPDIDDYIAASGMLLLSLIVTNYLIRRHSRLLKTAEAEAKQKSEQASDLIELNVKLRASERELGALRDYLSSIIDSMPSFLVSVDSQGMIVQWNREAYLMTDIPAEDAVGKPLVELMPNMTAQLKMAKEAIKKNAVLTSPPERIVDSALKEKESTERYRVVTVYPLKTVDLLGAVIRIDDITDQVRMQEMIVHTEKMMSVGGLAAGMAHEINNPLGGILQNTGVIRNRLIERMPANLRVADELNFDFELMQKYLEKRQIVRMLDLVSESGKRAADIVYNMLSFSRKNSGGMLPVQLCDVVKHTLEIAETEFDLSKNTDFKKIHVNLDCLPCPAVLCETPKIQQVLLNVFRNGADAMQEASAAGATDRRPEFNIRVAPDATNKWVTVEIEDNGPGMDESVRKRVFEPFFTTKEVGKGTGLGLSVSYFIVVENHGGRIEVRSQKGVGTTFYIHLPV